MFTYVVRFFLEFLFLLYRKKFNPDQFLKDRNTWDRKHSLLMIKLIMENMIFKDISFYV